MIKHIKMKPKNGLNTSVDSQTCSDEMPSKQETFSYVEKNIFSYIRNSLKWGKYCGDEYFSFVYIFTFLHKFTQIYTNLLRWSHFTFIYNRSTNMNYFI